MGMVVLLVRLKLRLLRNVLRTSAGPGLVIFTILALIMGLSVGFSLRNSSDIDRIIFSPIIGASFVFTWVLGPIFFGASDETIDTTRLALFPLDTNQVAVGLAASSIIGPGPLAALIALSGVASRSPTVPSAILAAIAVLLTLALATTTSRLLLTGLGSSLRSRRTRDMATIATGLTLGFVGLGIQLLGAFRDSLNRERFASIADIARLTPLGWPGDALGRASTGALLIPLVELLGTAALLTVVVRAWGSLLRHALTQVTESSEDSEELTPLVRSGGPDRPVSALVATFQKERRYFSRHPRYRVQVVTQLTVLLIGGAPFIGAIVRGDPDAVLLGCIPGLTAGVTGANLLGPDGRSLWAEYMAMPSLTPLLRGRSLAFAAMGLTASVILTFGTAAWTGGWHFVPAALGAAIGMALTGSGVGSITSVYAPTPYPEDGSPNPFATSSPGAGCLPAILTFSGVIMGLLLSAPVLFGLAIARGATWGIVAVTIGAPIYGAILWFGGTAFAGRRATRRGPELVSSLGRAA